jgi:hypothetical protein
MTAGLQENGRRARVPGSQKVGSRPDDLPVRSPFGRSSGGQREPILGPVSRSGSLGLRSDLTFYT